MKLIILGPHAQRSQKIISDLHEKRQHIESLFPIQDDHKQMSTMTDVQHKQGLRILKAAGEHLTHAQFKSGVTIVPGKNYSPVHVTSQGTSQRKRLPYPT